MSSRMDTTTDLVLKGNFSGLRGADAPPSIITPLTLELCPVWYDRYNCTEPMFAPQTTTLKPTAPKERQFLDTSDSSLLLGAPKLVETSIGTCDVDIQQVGVSFFFISSVHVFLVLAC